MSASPVRLALVGHPDDVADWAAVAPRLTGGVVSVIADTMEAALGDNDADFDAAVVGTYLNAHVALAAGKHVLVKAPVAETLDQIEVLLKMSRQTGVEIGVGDSSAHRPGHRVILDHLKSGKLGAPGLLRVHRWGSVKQTLAQAVYGDIDFALDVFGEAPDTVYGLDREGGAYRQIHLGFPKGGMAVLDHAENLPAGQPYTSLSLVGSSGAAYADDHHNTHLLFAGQNPEALISPSGTGALEELQTFVDEVESQAGDSVRIHRVHQVIASVRRSMEAAQVLEGRGGADVPD